MMINIFGKIRYIVVISVYECYAKESGKMCFVSLSNVIFLQVWGTYMSGHIYVNFFYTQCNTTKEKIHWTYDMT